ncbi:MAG: HAD-IIB family hydrolase [Myxococcota bacterium]
MDFDMLVLDLDGTTLDDNSELRPIDIAAAHALAEHGVHVTIATGRLFTGTQWVAKALGVQGGVAVMNGNEIIDANTTDVVHGRYVGPEARRVARERFAEHDLRSAFLFGSRRIHLAHHDAFRSAYLSTWTHDLELHDDVFAIDEWRSATDIVAVGAVGDPAAVERVRERIHRETDDTLQSVVFRTSLGETFLKFRHQGDNKGTALEKMAAARGTTPERTVAVGDWLNDVTMLRRAGRSFAMRNADERVIAAADETLRTEVAGGGAVAEVAERVWGITP